MIEDLPLPGDAAKVVATFKTEPPPESQLLELARLRALLLQSGIPGTVYVVEGRVRAQVVLTQAQLERLVAYA